MRFGVLGPANGNLAALEEGASLLLFEHHAEEIILHRDGNRKQERVGIPKVHCLIWVQ